MISYSSRSSHSLGREKVAAAVLRLPPGRGPLACTPDPVSVSWFDRLHLCSHSGDLTAPHLAGHPQLRNLRAGPETLSRPQLSPF